MKFFAVVCLLREIVALDTTLHSRTVEYEDVNTTSTRGGVHGMPHASILEAGTSSDVARLSSRHSTDSLTLRRSSQPVRSYWKLPKYVCIYMLQTHFWVEKTCSLRTKSSLFVYIYVANAFFGSPNVEKLMQRFIWRGIYMIGSI